LYMQRTENWVTMVTPFTSDGRIDLGAIPALVDYYAQYCDGIFAVCQSSEMFYMTLEERVSLAKAVIGAAADRLPVVVSGHISDTFDAQLEEAHRMSDLGAVAFVLVSNRLAAVNDDDHVWIEHLDALVSKISGALGMYECPQPYKRLLTQRTYTHLAQNERFIFFKDTCCDTAVIRRRLEWSAICPNSKLRLLNANTDTLLRSMRDGSAGFSGVMANFHPELYQWLTRHWHEQPAKADALQSTLTSLSKIEQYGYPACAKMHMAMLGLPINPYCRSGAHNQITGAMPETLKQVMVAEAEARESLSLDICHIA
jgi:4-hydroxy-tetrahydrodipicolinate synthase